MTNRYFQVSFSTTEDLVERAERAADLLEKYELSNSKEMDIEALVGLKVLLYGIREGMKCLQS